jgi:lipid II:glycine glycyltransferase (peptidoglycan interpeptide bridge formation enzyme)
MQYRKSNKSEINQLRKSGFTIKKADHAEEIKKFGDIYEITMRRVNAPAHYFFDLDYFNNFLSATDFNYMLLLAYCNNEIAAGAIFTIVNNIMQYHLAGTAETYLKKAPMKLVIDEARLLANSKKLTYLHLGGGVGGSDDDSLFKFKSGFSNLNYVFKVWKWIIDEEKYVAITKIKCSGKEINSNFFPQYRSY